MAVKNRAITYARAYLLLVDIECKFEIVYADELFEHVPQDLAALVQIRGQELDEVGRVLNLEGAGCVHRKVVHNISGKEKKDF